MLVKTNYLHFQTNDSNEFILSRVNTVIKKLSESCPVESLTVPIWFCVAKRDFWVLLCYRKTQTGYESIVDAEAMLNLSKKQQNAVWN